MIDEEREEKEEKKADPYIDGKKKVGSDIFVGIFWSIGLMIPFTIILFIGSIILGMNSLFGDPSPGSLWFFRITVIIYFSILIGLSLNYLKKNRRYVAIGIIIANLIYLIIRSKISFLI